jgi:hypothetical protein
MQKWTPICNNSKSLHFEEVNGQLHTPASTCLSKAEMVLDRGLGGSQVQYRCKGKEKVSASVQNHTSVIEHAAYYLLSYWLMTENSILNLHAVTVTPFSNWHLYTKQWQWQTLFLWFYKTNNSKELQVLKDVAGTFTPLWGTYSSDESNTAMKSNKYLCATFQYIMYYQCSSFSPQLYTSMYGSHVCKALVQRGQRKYQILWDVLKIAGRKIATYHMWVTCWEAAHWWTTEDFSKKIYDNILLEAKIHTTSS